MEERSFLVIGRDADVHDAARGVRVAGRPWLATRRVFATLEEATKYADGVHSSYRPEVVESLPVILARPEEATAERALARKATANLARYQAGYHLACDLAGSRVVLALAVLRELAGCSSTARVYVAGFCDGVLDVLQGVA